MDNDTPPPARKVLCIEDQFFISELYQRALNRAGFETMMTADGETGLKEALTDRYDIILLDLMLPQVVGIDVLRALRGEGAPKLKAKIIITTNLDVEEEQKSELEKMADGYLIKAEITPKQLVGFLQTLN